MGAFQIYIFAAAIHIRNVMQISRNPEPTKTKYRRRPKLLRCRNGGGDP
jgi:hypothetical protein